MASSYLSVVLVMSLFVFVSVGADEVVSPGENTRDVAVDAVTACVREANNFSSYIVKLREEEKTKSPMICNALSECVQMMEDAVSELYTAIQKLKKLPDSHMRKNVYNIRMLLFEVNRNPEQCIDELVTAVLSDPEIWSKPNPSQIVTMVQDRSKSLVQSVSHASSVVAKLLPGGNH